jgi:Rad3-related DNA helicase
MSKRENNTIERAVEESFPAPGFREYQKRSIVEIVKAFEEEDKDLVLYNAPTGSGKSLVIYGAAAAMNQLNGWESFITTPLNALVDQVDVDEFIGGNIITLKGRNNYDCIHPEDRGTAVNEAICQRDSSFECDRKEQCEYYGRKYAAIEHPYAYTNMAYLMAESMIPGTVEGTFGNRDILFVDECQSLEDFGMNYVSFTVSYRTVPDQVWSNVSIPPEDKEDDMEYMKTWLEEEVLRAVGHAITHLDSIGLMDKDESQELENLKQFRTRVENFLDDVEDNDWVSQIDVDIRKNRPNAKKAVFKPIEIGRFLDDLLWSRADKIVLSSATIPGGGWLEEIGLGGVSAKKMNVPSTFPVENRPIIMGESVGKMTKAERDKNALPMAKKIMAIAEHHEGEKGFVHCRSYNIAKMLKRALTSNGHNRWFKNNVMMQDRYNREESLENWVNSDKQVFFSVAMDEGVDLEGDKCRWQVLAKTLYKHMGDKRTRFRVQERGEWDWYNRHAAIQIQQAYGRAVRSKEDEAVFYVLDESAKGLIQMNAHLFNGWFLEAIQDIKVDPNRGR